MDDYLVFYELRMEIGISNGIGRLFMVLNW